MESNTERSGPPALRSIQTSSNSKPSRQDTNLTESSNVRENLLGILDANVAQQSQMRQKGGQRIATSNATPIVSESGFFNGGADGISPAASSIRDHKSKAADELVSQQSKDRYRAYRDKLRQLNDQTINESQLNASDNRSYTRSAQASRSQH